MLTHTQRKGLLYIERYQRETGGVSPSYQEIANETGLTSRSSVAALVRNLEFRGFVRVLRKRRRAIEVLIKPKPIVKWFRFDDVQKELKPRD